MKTISNRNINVGNCVTIDKNFILHQLKNTMSMFLTKYDTNNSH